MAVNMTTQSIAVGNDWTKVGNDYVGDNPSGVISGGSSGYQPAGTTKPGDPNLVYNFNAILEAAYQGFFHLPSFASNPHPDYPDVDYAGANFNAETSTARNGAIAFSPSGSLFVAGYSGAFDSSGLTGSNAGGADSVCEVSIPALIAPSDLNDRSGIQSASLLQNWSGAFNPAHGLVEPNGQNAHSILGLYYDRLENALNVHVMRDYDNAPFLEGNLVVYRTPNSLSTSSVDGFISTGKAGASATDYQHSCGYAADIPSSWQASLGGRTLFGGAAAGAVLERLPAGPTLFAGAPPSSAVTSGAMTVTQHLDYFDSVGQHFGESYFASRVDGLGSWYNYEMYNADREDETPYDPSQEITDAAQIDAWINDWWTIKTRAFQGFIIPNTNTYVVVGSIEGGAGGIGYKAWPEWSDSRGGGPIRLQEDDYHNKYWLFDITDIQSAANPWEVFPYEHGNLTMLDSMLDQAGNKTRAINATFDLHTGQLAFVVRNRQDGLTYSGEADIVIFQSNAWQEAV